MPIEIIIHIEAIYLQNVYNLYKPTNISITFTPLETNLKHAHNMDGFYDEITK